MRGFRRVEGRGKKRRISEVLVGETIEFQKLQTYETDLVEGRLPIPPDWLLYDHEDCYLTKNESDGPQAVKAGDLYIAFQRDGTGSYAVTIYRIDYEKHSLRHLFDFSNGRYGDIDMSILLPFPRDPVATQIRSRTTAMHLGNLEIIRLNLIKMALRQAVDPIQFRWPLVNIYAAQRVLAETPLRESGSLPPVEVVAPAGRDVKIFCAQPGLEPRNVPELAAKIAAVYYAEMGIDAGSIARIIKEYLDASRKTLESINNPDFANRLLNILIDEVRYPLKDIFAEGDNGAMIRDALTAIAARAAAERQNRELINQLNAYVAQRRSESESIASFFGIGYSKLQKIAAAQTAIKAIRDGKPIGSEHLGVLQDGRLGRVFASYQLSRLAGHSSPAP